MSYGLWIMTAENSLECIMYNGHGTIDSLKDALSIIHYNCSRHS